MLESLVIHSGQGEYRVNFFPDIRSLVDGLAANSKTVVLIDANVARLYANVLRSVTSQPTLVIPASEEEKTPDGVLKVLNFFQASDCNTSSTVIAIGGGIIQDIATFASHVYYRGLKWSFVPTTLLSMSDSCIGAKAGINFNRFKNQLGVFHSPSRVSIALPFLETLADAEIASGYGEIIKLLLTGPSSQFDDLREVVDRDGFRNRELLRFIRQSLEVKQGVIEADEYERDLRRILNYGHTFGHAVEAISNYALPHGHAVAWGMDLVNFVSWKRGLLSAAHYRTIHDFLARHYSIHIPCGVTAADLIRSAGRDKKASAGSVSLILAERPGQLRIVPTPLDEALEATISDYLRTDNLLDWD